MAAEDQTPDVLTSLPRTRPQRRSAKRDAPKKATSGQGAEGHGREEAAPSRRRSPKPKPLPRRSRRPGTRALAQDQAGGTPSGVELVGTAIQAAGELAQIGAAIGKQALKSALRIGR